MGRLTKAFTISVSSPSYVRLLSASIGKWQILLVTFTCTVLAMLSANDTAMFFYAPEQSFHCALGDNECYMNVELSKSTNSPDYQNNETNSLVVTGVQYSMEKCSDWVYDESYWKRTIIKEVSW